MAAIGAVLVAVLVRNRNKQIVRPILEQEETEPDAALKAPSPRLRAAGHRNSAKEKEKYRASRKDSGTGASGGGDGAKSSTRSRKGGS